MRTPFAERLNLNRIQLLYKFENGYGASVIRNEYLLLYELAVIRFKSADWEIVYDTPITDNVVSNLSEKDVDDYLNWIEALPNLAQRDQKRVPKPRNKKQTIEKKEDTTPEQPLEQSLEKVEEVDSCSCVVWDVWDSVKV